MRLLLPRQTPFLSFMGHLLSQRMDSRHLSRLKMRSCGWAKALKKFGLKAYITVNDYEQEGFGEVLPKNTFEGHEKDSRQGQGAGNCSKEISVSREPS